MNCASRRSLTITERVTAYKYPRGDKTIRGVDIDGIGEHHEFRDKVMMIEGTVIVLHENETRLKVSAEARAVRAGDLYCVIAWIEKSGVA